ncbi:RHS repeat-associated core domain-containing protein [Frateuria edaphi]|uniref:RHS repeat-associated core domain-containing protein n=1 Tax=Frateuria edaphi TaxID=2898793 RepID=UPI003CE449E8
MTRNFSKFICLLLVPDAFGVAHAGTVTYIYTDPQGTPLAEADSSGAVTSTYEYRPYGKQILGGVDNGPGFTGHVNDPDSGLVYMEARYYDSSLGRFLSVDLVGMGAKAGFEFNRYAYVLNNPIVAVDPSGAFPEHMSASQITCEVYRCETSGSGDTSRAQMAARATRLADSALTNAGVLGHAYTTSDQLAMAWADAVVPVTIKLNVEIGSSIMYLKDSGFTCTATYSSGDRNTIDMEVAGVYFPTTVAEIHTHPDNHGFSGTTAYAFPGDRNAHVSGSNGTGDLVRYFNNNINGYVALPNGAVYGWRVQPFRTNVDYSGGYHFLSEPIYQVRRSK